MIKTDGAPTIAWADPADEKRDTCPLVTLQLSPEKVELLIDALAVQALEADDIGNYGLNLRAGNLRDYLSRVLAARSN